MRKADPPATVLKGNDRFEGYAVDLMEKICGYLNCSFTFEVVPDGQYGNYNPEKKEWNGLIRELLDRVRLLLKFGECASYMPCSLQLNEIKNHLVTAGVNFENF